MNTCPKCHTDISLSTIIFLNRLNPKFNCPQCGDTIEADKTILSLFGGLIVGLFIVSMNGGHYLADTSDEPIYKVYGVLIGLLAAGLMLFFQSNSIKLKISEEKLPKGKEIVVKKQKFHKPTLSENPSEVETFKLKFYKMSDLALSQIANDSSRIDEARQAAKELLKERASNG